MATAPSTRIITNIRNAPMVESAYPIPVLTYRVGMSIAARIASSRKRIKMVETLCFTSDIFKTSLSGLCP